MELSTRADHTSAIYRHIMWYFGPMRMRDIGPAQVREWITELNARGVSARRIEYAKNSVLGANFTTARNEIQELKSALVSLSLKLHRSL